MKSEKETPQNDKLLTEVPQSDSIDQEAKEPSYVESPPDIIVDN